MKKLFNKNFWFGFMSGFMFLFLIILALLFISYWLGNHPVTDCDSCLNGTTP